MYDRTGNNGSEGGAVIVSVWGIVKMDVFLQCTAVHELDSLSTGNCHILRSIVHCIGERENPKPQDTLENKQLIKSGMLQLITYSSKGRSKRKL